MKKIAIILASGNGSRVSSSSIPKQFIKVDNNFLLMHCLKRFYKHKDIDAIVLSLNSNYIKPFKRLLTNLNMDDKVFLVEGGYCRNESLKKAVIFLDTKLNVQDDDIILSHDGVRIFVDDKIIDANIKKLEQFEADVVYTGVFSKDTIGFKNSNDYVFNIPNRDLCFLGQTPQSAFWKTFKLVYKNEYDKKLYENSDFCKLASINNKSICFVNGSELNFKITTDFDVEIAKYLIQTKKLFK